MGFRTKIDYSTNRQVRQTEKTNTILSGGTTFGLPFSGLTTGPNLNTIVITEDNGGLTGTTFSGNLTTTIYTFADSRMDLASNAFSAITTTTSGVTQESGIILTGATTGTTDGNNYYTSYTGVSFSIDVETINQSGNTFTGTIEHYDYDVVSSDAIDFSGRTIWIDNQEITRTDRLIITRGATPGSIFTSDAEGMGSWVVGSADANDNDYVDSASFSADTGDLLLTMLSGGTVTANLDGRYELIGAGTGIYWASGSTSTSVKIINASSNSATGKNALSTGWDTISSGDYSYSQGYGSDASGRVSHAEGSGTTASGDFSHAEGFNTTASGNYSHAQGNNTIASGINSFAGGDGTTGFEIIASGDTSFAFFKQTITTMPWGAFGDNSAILGGQDHFIAADALNGAILGGNNNVIYNKSNSAIIGGQDCVISGGTGRTVLLACNSITATTNDMVYVPDLIIDGLVSVTDLQTDANGKIIDGVSDIRLKENITELDSALNKVKALRGVSFTWKPESEMGDGIQYGMIAQEVQQVIPDMVKSRRRDPSLLSLDYKAVVPWLVEAVKELATPNIILNETEIDTETVTSEDNYIQLNFNGTKESAIGGGIIVINGRDDGDSKFTINSNGDWTTNNYVIPRGLIIPEYTPTSKDDAGMIGEITRDNSNLYIKNSDGWKKIRLEDID
tara:strand:+ start:72072 stop:74105 length:2034 start_codon:yes stop_codon:yes gene_type:complete